MSRIITVCGTGFERGLAHGEALRTLIADVVGRWHQHLSDTRRMDPSDYIECLLSTTSYRRFISSTSQDLAAEIRGIAAGANQEFDHMLAYNLLDEQWWFKPTTTAPACSVIATTVTSPAMRGQTTLIAQNMDLPEWMNGSQVVLRIEQPDAPDQIVLTSAGHIGLTGVNARGLAICVNSLLALARSRNGIPVALVFRRALQCADVDAAANFLESIEHASGQHYGLADPTRMQGFECSAGAVVRGPSGRSELIHTNHPMWSTDLHSDKPPSAGAAAQGRNSRKRLHALAAEVEDVRRSGSARSLLSRTDLGLCVVPTDADAQSTFGSVEYLLTDPPTVRIALGRPDIVPWLDVKWATGSTGPDSDTTPHAVSW